MRKCLSLLFLSISLAGLGFAQASGECAGQVSRIHNPLGWPIPDHQKSIQPDAKVLEGFRTRGIQVTQFEPGSQTYVLPNYFFRRGALVLHTHEFKIRRLYSLNKNGKNFGWVFDATGESVGAGFNVLLLDVEGRGRFQLLQLGNVEIDVPEWVEKQKPGTSSSVSP